MITDFALGKRIAAVGLAGVLFMSGLSTAMADDLSPDPTNNSTIDKLKDDLERFGKFFGYDITQEPSPLPGTDIGLKTLQSLQTSAIKLLLGTIPGSSIVDPDPNNLNELINTLFKTQNAKGSPALQTNLPINQKAIVASSNDGDSTGGNSIGYPSDPVTQSIVNLLATPSFSMCNAVKALKNSSSATATNSNCFSDTDKDKTQYQEAIPLHVIGKLPNAAEAYSISTGLAQQLNSDTLIAPLIYSSASVPAVTDSSSDSKPTELTGLQATNQAQQAENFIRYASSAVVPPAGLSGEVFNKIYGVAINTNNAPDIRVKAISSLSSYFASMRTFAAQISIGTGNLYHMLAKRMPQQDNSGGATPASSAAYNEYVMATKRLYTPVQASASDTAGQTPNQQWAEKINNASPATVQKEIAILLSEINYQLYLSRQQEERLLLTNTAMLFQLARLTTPDVPAAPDTADDEK